MNGLHSLKFAIGANSLWFQNYLCAINEQVGIFFILARKKFFFVWLMTDTVQSLGIKVETVFQGSYRKNKKM